MIDRLKENRTFYICLSVVLAVLFWLYVREVEDPVMDGNVWNVPIELTGESILATQGLAVAEISENTADFKVKAPASVLENLSRKNVTAILDVSKCVAGENILHYTPKVSSSVNTDGVSWIAQSPSVSFVVASSSVMLTWRESCLAPAITLAGVTVLSLSRKRRTN